MGKKPKNAKKEEQQAKFCSVCKLKMVDRPNLEKIRCSECYQVVHKFCYAPDFKQSKNNKFKCDLCKKRSARGKSKVDKVDKAVCSFCGIPDGILKEISNGQWMHVLCALTAPKVNLLDYQSLRFSSQSNQVLKQTKPICSYCQKTGYTQPCLVNGCKQRIHLNCLMTENSILRKEQDQVHLNVNRLGLLNRNEGSLLYKLKKQQKKFSRALDLVQNEGKVPQYFICKQHNDSSHFIWCYCEKEALGQKQIQCQACFRWYHENCNSYQNPEGRSIFCKGCKDNDIYIKNMSIPELIAQAIKVQNKQTWDKTHIKFLDHFALKYSIQIEKRMKEQANRLTIQRYFLRKELNSFDKYMNDEDKQGHLMQILYYLFKKEIKTQAQITIQDIQQMLGDIISSSEKLNLKWSEQKPQKLWKNFLQNKLKKLKKNDLREIKTKTNLLKKQLANNVKNQKQIVSVLYPVLKLLSNSQVQLSAFKKNHEKSLNFQILEFLVGLQLSKSELQDILRSFKILITAKNNKFIEEDDYHSVNFKICPTLTQYKLKDLQKIHLKLLKGVNQRKLYQKRREILSKMEEKQEQKNYQQNKILRNSIITNGLLIPSHFKSFRYEADTIEVQIKKRRYLKKNNITSFSQLSQVIQNLQQLLDANYRVGVMEEQQKKSFQVLYQKYKLFNTLFLYVNQIKKKLAYQNMQMGVLQQPLSSQSSNKDNVYLKVQQRLQKQLYSIVNDWPLSPEAIYIGITNLYQACSKQVCFTQQQQKIITVFFDKLIFEMHKILSQGVMFLKPSLLKQIVCVAKHLKNEEKWEHYMSMHSQYYQWKQKLDQDFIEIEKVLECPQKTKDLIVVVDQKLAATVQFNNCLDVSSEIRKLRILRTWAIFTQKMLIPQKKATLTAIQNARSLMEKIMYPKNSVRTLIEKLDLQSKTLNKKIGRFLQRQKLTEMDYYDELKLIQAKMTIKQAEELQQELQNSMLDVEIQLNELKQQLNNSKQYPANLVGFCQQSKKLETIADLRRKIIEGPFLFYSLKDYQYLLQAYYSKKCEEFSGTITKKQYFRMLDHGGISSFELYKKTQALFKMYKEIQTAQKQIVSPRPRPQLLLNHDIKKIKADLKEDPAEFSRVERYYHLANKLRQKFYSFREERADIQKYNSLESDLIRLPVNLKDICNELNRMKRELQDCSNKVRIYFCDQNQIIHLQFCSPFCSQLLIKYQRSGIRNEIMNKFEIIITKARQLSEIFNNLNFANYKTFSLLCTSCKQLEKNDQIYTKRMSAFQQMYQSYIKNAEPLIEVGLTLLTEGGFLTRRPNVAEQLLLKLLNVNNELLNSEKRMLQPANYENGEENEESEDQELQNSNQQEYDEENLDSDNLNDSDDIQNIDLEDDDDEEEEDLDIQSNQDDKKKEALEEKQKSRRRPRPNQYVISDSEHE